MADIVLGYAPNRITTVFTDATTDMVLIAMDGTGYASLSSLLAAGKTPFPYGNATTPGLDQGMFTQYWTVENVTEAKAFNVAWNTGTLPTNDSSELIPDGLVQFTSKGVPLKLLWLQKSVASDHLVCTAGY